MVTFALDASCMVAALLGEHEDRERAASAINERLDGGDTMLIVGHAVVETYSVLTRLPPPSHVAPADAHRAIERAFLAHGTVVTLDAAEYHALLREFVSRGVMGGQVYDAAIVACARARGADALLTFNERHFRRFEGNGLTIVVP